MVFKETEEYLRIRRYLRRAKAFLEDKDADTVLSCCRNGLELTVKVLTQYAALELPDTLEAVIDLLLTNGVLTADEADLMHKIRVLGNKGAHVDIDTTVALEDAELAVQYFESMMISLDEKDIDTLIANVPMEDPDWYSSGQKYRGRWGYLNWQGASVDPAFIRLYRAAKENKDISALISLTIGFLPPNGDVFLSNLSLDDDYDAPRINDKPDRNAFKVFPPDRLKIGPHRAYKYYAFAIYTSIKAYDAWTKGEQYPKRYMTTIVWDAIVGIRVLEHEKDKHDHEQYSRAVDGFEWFEEFFQEKIYEENGASLRKKLFKFMKTDLLSCGKRSLAPIYRLTNDDILRMEDDILKYRRSRVR